MKKTLLIALLATFTANAAEAFLFGGPGIVERACLGSDRKRVTRALCGCIQNVADKSLSRHEQKRAVDFFREPHLSQVVRQSSRPNDERFWLRYKRFASSAERSCR